MGSNINEEYFNQEEYSCVTVKNCRKNQGSNREVQGFIELKLIIKCKEISL